MVRRFPMIAGHRFRRNSRIVEPSRVEAGRRVILNGWGCGETHLGGYGEKARVKGDWLVRVPAEHERARGDGDRHGRLHRHARRDGARASRGHACERPGGGDGCRRRRRLGCDRNSCPSCGFQVMAVDWPAERRPATCKISARTRSSIAQELAGPAKPLAKERWAGGIDAVGSTTLANVLSMTRYGGAVAACGLAGGMDLPTSVAPFILRGVSLLGIDSVMRPKRRSGTGLEASGNGS